MTRREDDSVWTRIRVMAGTIGGPTARRILAGGRLGGGFDPGYTPDLNDPSETLIVTVDVPMTAQDYLGAGYDPAAVEAGRR